MIRFVTFAVAYGWQAVMEVPANRPADFHTPAYQAGPNRNEDAQAWIRFCAGQPLRDEGNVGSLGNYVHVKIEETPEIEVMNGLNECIEKKCGSGSVQRKGFLEKECE